MRRFLVPHGMCHYPLHSYRIVSFGLKQSSHCASHTWLRKPLMNKALVLLRCASSAVPRCGDTYCSWFFCGVQCAVPTQRVVFSLLRLRVPLMASTLRWCGVCGPHTFSLPLPPAVSELAAATKVEQSCACALGAATCGKSKAIKHIVPPRLVVESYINIYILCILHMRERKEECR